MTGVPGKDFNSGLKAMRRDVVDEIDLYGEMHRYIPVLAVANGFSVGEVDVPHRARLHGEIEVRAGALLARLLRPHHREVPHDVPHPPVPHPRRLRARRARSSAAALLTWMFVDMLLGQAVGRRPALIAGMLFVLVGVQLAATGLIAELLVSRTRVRDTRPRCPRRAVSRRPRSISLEPAVSS